MEHLFELQMVCEDLGDCSKSSCHGDCNGQCRGGCKAGCHGGCKAGCHGMSR